MGAFTYKLHNRFGRLTRKLSMLLWYQSLFYKTGVRCSISRPLFMHHPEYIQLGNRVSIGPYCRIEVHPASPGNRRLKPVRSEERRVGKEVWGWWVGVAVKTMAVALLEEAVCGRL